MKNLGGYPGADWPQWPDYICNVQAASTGSVVTGDLTTGSSAAQYARIISNVVCWFNPSSTGAAVPSTQAVAGQSVSKQVSPNYPFQTQIPPGSTGWSLAFLTTPGYATVAFFKK